MLSMVVTGHSLLVLAGSGACALLLSLHVLARTQARLRGRTEKSHRAGRPPASILPERPSPASRVPSWPGRGTIPLPPSVAHPPRPARPGEASARRVGGDTWPLASPDHPHLPRRPIAPPSRHLQEPQRDAFQRWYPIQLLPPAPVRDRSRASSRQRRSLLV
jgi:hypothetical protein